MSRGPRDKPVLPLEACYQLAVARLVGDSGGVDVPEPARQVAVLIPRDRSERVPGRWVAEFGPVEYVKELRPHLEEHFLPDTERAAKAHLLIGPASCPV